MHSDTNFHEEARLLALLANEKRLVIASLLLDNELNVGELAKRVGLSQSALSQHLARLREGKIVTTRRDAQTIYYSTTHYGVRKILSTLDEICTRPTVTVSTSS
ncbi:MULTISPECIES: metalloregulator ArsR/SmtB family transcription factor [unclassified Rhizobium]|uniref:ArsR/SmtB family transcription factor n=1 Tax=unclassified Rhizobium TaxID=2613769 RepID=UPI00104D0216|nr:MULTISPECIES: metalloregulator ArsR/SmtB family transcription factor [unclassified Rhizobium]MBB3398902.1 DNA-binding transcriptional ArsR family regulator [Rhizobium sp. BK060]MBB4171508.1 DNA-binding transcriptional ArsR family regulator [Rhizobium sp. BK538]TCM68281.1 ArsR family transcriptional regulator [Rhizobium sp. BK068]